MNRQEVFDKVARHLLTQGKRAVGEDGYCKYRGNDGTSCAIGCLIPDKDYTSEMEGRGIESTQWVNNWDSKVEALRDVLNKIFPNLTPEDRRFLRDLQLIHDRGAILDWSSLLEKLAFDYKLDIGVLDELKDSLSK